MNKNQIDKKFKKGLLFLQNKRINMAINVFIEINKKYDNPDVNNLLGICYREKGNINLALKYTKKAIKQSPGNIGFYNNLGNIYTENNNFSEAKKIYLDALKLSKKYDDTLYNLGVMYRYQHNFKDAELYFKKFITKNNKNIYALDNLGCVLYQRGKFDEAIFYFKKAIKINPQFSLAHWNLSLVLIMTKKYLQGWKEYEWRLKLNNNHIDKFFINKKIWNGSPLTKKILVVCCEQGIGDNIQFARYISKINYLNTKIIIYCKKNMNFLLNKFPNISKITNKIKDIKYFDYYLPIMSFPNIYGTKITNIPKKINFIYPDKINLMKWKKILNKKKGLKIGITWQGDKNHQHDWKRSIKIKYFKELFELNGVNFISLQKDFKKKQIEKYGLLNLKSYFNKDFDKIAFRDTVSIIANLDLVITVDTAIAHISATMGKETWTLLSKIPDYRWSSKGKITKWYNQMIFFRQKKSMDWVPVIKEIKKKLIKKIKNV